MGIPKENMETFVNRMIETMLLGHTSRGLSKIFMPSQNEVLLDQHDINNNKVNELIEYQKNPFKLLSERLEDVTDSFIFDKTLNVRSISKIYITPQSEFGEVPVIWRKKLSEFAVLQNVAHYNPFYMYSLFVNVNDVINPQRQITNDTLRSIIKTRIINDYKKSDRLEHLFDNENFKLLAKTLHQITKFNVKPPLAACLDVVDSMNYYPYMYELFILADVVGVNVVVIGRRNKENPDGLTYIDKKSHYTLVLQDSYDRFNKFNRFEQFVKSKKTILFKKNDLPIDFQRVLENKNKIFEIEVEDD
jgi:hypothetical protein